MAAARDDTDLARPSKSLRLVNDADTLARLWALSRGYVAATARREGVSPHRVLEVLADRLPSDEEWWGSLADYDADVRAALVDNIDTED